MKALLATIAATAFFAVAAYAAEVQGVVQSVDTEARIIMLEDGTVLSADEEVDLESLAAGDEVTVTVDETTTSATAVEQNDGM